VPFQRKSEQNGTLGHWLARSAPNEPSALNYWQKKILATISGIAEFGAE
jgi:hypothetical protein